MIWPGEGFGPDADAGPDAGADEFDRVVQQVAEALRQQRFIPQHGQLVELNANLGGWRLQIRIGFNHAPQQTGHIHGRERRILTHNLVVIQRVGNQPVQAVGGHPDAPGIVQARGA